MEADSPANTLPGAEMVPDNSLLREFVGGSILEDFEPWHKGMVVEEG